MRIEELSWEDGVTRLADPWRKLLAAADGNYSFSPEWMHAAATAFGLAPALRVLAAFDGQELVGVVPYRLSRTRICGLPLRALDPAGSVLVTYHHELVTLDRHAELLRDLLDRTGWHLFRAEMLTTGGATDRALADVAAARGYGVHTFDGEASPYLTIDRTWEEYLATKSSNFRYNLRRKEKNVLKAGQAEHKWLTSAGDVEELQRCMLDIEAASWKVSAGIAVSSREHERRYYAELLPALAARGTLLANVLRVAGEPIAYTICSSWNGKVCQMKTTFKEARGKLSPGAVTIQYAVQRAFETGAREFDFLGDQAAHKGHWSDECRAHRTCHVFSRRLMARAAHLIRKHGKRLVRRRVPVEGPAAPQGEPADAPEKSEPTPSEVA